MTQEQKKTKARMLRIEGLTFREIGERFGVAPATARRWVDPAAYELHLIEARIWKRRNRERKARADRAYRLGRRVECPQCGRKMEHNARLCSDCISDERHHRAVQIEQWWAEGLKLTEIAHRLGWTENHVGVEFAHLRQDGYHLPHRYRVRNGVRLPEKVAA